MKIWQIESLDDIKLAESSLSRGDGEVKLKISKIALSSTDLSYVAGRDTDIKTPGHSAIAYVSEADEASGLKLGSRVVVSPFLAYDYHGEKKVKVMGVDCDGLLRDFVDVPLENACALPDGIPDEEAIFAEYIAFGNKIIENMDCEKGDYVVIMGASTLGLTLSQLASYYQMVPILIDLDSEKLKIAEGWGVYYTLNPTYDNLERRVEEITGGRMSDFAVYAGEALSFDSAIRLVKDKGVAIIAGYSCTVKHKADMDGVLQKQLTVKGICNGYGEMPSAINLLANKIVKTDGFLNAQANFDNIPELVRECAKYPYQYNKILVSVD